MRIHLCEVETKVEGRLGLRWAQEKTVGLKHEGCSLLKSSRVGELAGTVKRVRYRKKSQRLGEVELAITAVTSQRVKFLDLRPDELGSGRMLPNRQGSELVCAGKNGRDEKGRILKSG